MTGKDLEYPLWDETSFIEAPSKDLWPNIDSAIKYESRLALGQKREQRLLKRTKILSLATAACMTVIIAQTIFSVLKPSAGVNADLVISADLPASFEVSSELQALMAKSGLHKHSDFAHLGLLSKKTKIHIQYEDENMDKKTVAAGVFGLLTGSGAAAFILDPGQPQSQQEAASATGTEPIPKQRFTESSDHPVSFEMCKKFIDKACGDGKTGKAPVTINDTAIETASSNVKPLSLEQRMDEIRHRIDTEIPKDYYARIPSGFESLAQASYPSEFIAQNEEVLSKYEKSLDQSIDRYKSINEFYARSASSRDVERESRLVQEGIELSAGNLVIDHIDCLEQDCLVYGRAEAMWQIQKFNYDLKESFPNVQMRGLRGGWSGQDREETIFLVRLHFQN